MIDAFESFDALASAALPGYHVSVGMHRRRTATGAATRFVADVTGNGLTVDLRITGASAAEVVAQMKKRVAQHRRVVESDKLLSSLEAEWNDVERAGMREKLLQAHDARAYATHAAQILLADKARYDAQMGHAYEQAGYYDTDEAA